MYQEFVYKDGDLYRKTKQGMTVAGWETVCNHKKYRKVSVNGKTLYVHHIIFEMHYGYRPKVIDHIDGDSLNNKIENLREATQSQNIANSKKSRGNTSGYKGVTFRKDTQRWAAQIMVNYKHISLGCFGTPEEAAAAYERGAQKYFGEYSATAKAVQ